MVSGPVKVLPLAGYLGQSTFLFGSRAPVLALALPLARAPRYHDLPTLTLPVGIAVRRESLLTSPATPS